MAIARAAVLRIDTDGQFHVDNFVSVDAAEHGADIDADAGLPSMVISREQFIEACASGEDFR